MQIWVSEHDGIPGTEVFTSTSGFGTPIIVDKNTQIAYYYDSALGVTPISSGGEPWTFLFLTTDLTFLTNTPTLLSGFSFTPEASTHYVIEGQIFVETDTLDNSPCVGVSWPSGVSAGGLKLSQAHSSSGETLLFGPHSVDDRIEPASFPADTPLPAALNVTLVTGGSPSGDFALTISSLT